MSRTNLPSRRHRRRLRDLTDTVERGALTVVIPYLFPTQPLPFTRLVLRSLPTPLGLRQRTHQHRLPFAWAATPLRGSHSADTPVRTVEPALSLAAGGLWSAVRATAPAHCGVGGLAGACRPCSWWRRQRRRSD